MFLKRLSIENYKSLRNVEFEPTPLSVLVGPNGAGKSNFASAIDFLSDVYRLGLEMAIARKGGYENIAFRRQRRSKSPIRFEVTTAYSKNELEPAFIWAPASSDLAQEVAYRLTHRFSFKAQGQAIGAAFRVTAESFEIAAKRSKERSSRGFVRLAELARSEDGTVFVDVSRTRLAGKGFRRTLEAEMTWLQETQEPVGQQQLAFAHPWSPAVCTAPLRGLLQNCRVFQFAPLMSRAPGVPTPNPTLSMTGENLPAVVAWLKEHCRGEWKIVVEAMREIVPGLENIEVDYLHTKTLGLLFTERTSGRPWAADDVSDGTIRALAFLVALADPRNTALVIEELENSVHPWIIKVVVDRLRKLSETKSIILTTHSPVLIDVLRPSETWIVYKKAGETKLKNIVDIDGGIEDAWEKGEFRLSDYLDSGLLPQAVPGGEL